MMYGGVGREQINQNGAKMIAGRADEQSESKNEHDFR
jgi:hypothetical protein